MGGVIHDEICLVLKVMSFHYLNVALSHIQKYVITCKTSYIHTLEF